MAEGLRPGQLHELHVGGSIDDWHNAGFAGSTVVRIGNTILRPTGDDVGITAAVIDGVEQLDGLPVSAGPLEDAPDALEHPNGVVSIDHVVVTTQNPDATQSAFEAAGIETRRIRRFETKKGTHRQTFHWLGDVICEVAGPDTATDSGPATWWGLALTVSDIDATAEFLGDRVSDVKDAVQPGRRVTTLRSSAGVPTPILFISKHVRAE